MSLRYNIDQLSIGLAHALYRNTEVEDYHADDRLMDRSLYDDVYRVVSARMKLLAESRALLREVFQNGIDDAQRLVKEYPGRRVTFLAEILYGCECGFDWDAPRRIDARPQTDDLTAFLLEGEFQKRCDGVQSFDDSVMKPINKDIVDRACVLLNEITNAG